jgi:glycine/serine hydroxymethyltransferase
MSPVHLLQVLRNSKAMADRLQEHGYSLVSGGAYHDLIFPCIGTVSLHWN